MISKSHQRHLIGILLVVINLTVGCASFMEGFYDTSPPPPTTPDNDPFEYALSVYQRGDYRQAAELFSALSAGTGDDQSPEAQFGEICCRLILADSPEDLTVAMEMWKALKYSTGDRWRVEQTLLDPLIARLPVSTKKPLPEISTPATPDKQMEIELTALKKKAAKVTQLQRRLDAVIAENQTLKQKIKALEAIDQNIQKKKTEISAPSE